MSNISEFKPRPVEMLQEIVDQYDGDTHGPRLVKKDKKKPSTPRKPRAPIAEPFKVTQGALLDEPLTNKCDRDAREQIMGILEHVEWHGKHMSFMYCDIKYPYEDSHIEPRAFTPTEENLFNRAIEALYSMKALLTGVPQE